METIELGSVVLDVSALCDGTIEREIPAMGPEDDFELHWLRMQNIAHHYPLVTDANVDVVRELLLMLSDCYEWSAWTNAEPDEMSRLQMSAVIWSWIFDDRDSCEFAGGKWSYRFSVQEVKS